MHCHAGRAHQRPFRSQRPTRRGVDLRVSKPDALTRHYMQMHEKNKRLILNRKGYPK